MLRAGADHCDITPITSQFLYGYPHVERHSTGTNDPLMSSCLYLSDGREEVMFIANDLIFVDKKITARLRRRVSEQTAVPESSIMVTATHTHSGPITVHMASGAADPVVPGVDEAYIDSFVEKAGEAAVRAYHNAAPAEVGLGRADGSGVGTNRRDPSGPSDPEVPVLLVRARNGGHSIACLVVCSMHPTVLHENSTLVSADFPGYAREHLVKHVVGEQCSVLYMTGPAGNQSPRHVTRANTFVEAERLGAILADAIARVVPEIAFTSAHGLSCTQEFVDLPVRAFPDVMQATERVTSVRRHLEQLRNSGAPRQEIRTAECDWFGAEETLTLARASHENRLREAYDSCLPAEIQIISLGPWSFVGWPGEFFVEYSLAVKEKCEDTFVVSLANGELQGYVVTPEAYREGGYEASNALFDPRAGDAIVRATVHRLCGRSR